MNSSISSASSRQPEKRSRALFDRQRSARGNRRRPLSTLLRVVGVLGLMFPLTACGLEISAFLEPPRNDTILDFPPFPNVEFRHNSAVNQDGPGVAFLGYDIYYRFYDATEALFETHRSQIEASPVSLGPSRLTGRGYRRLRGLTVPQAADRQSPLIEIVSGVQSSPVKVELRFQDVVEPTFPESVVASGDAAARIPLDTGDNPPFTYLRLKRNISSAEVKSFYPLDTDNYRSGEDPDLSGINNLATLIQEGNLAIGLFVLASGIDPQSLQVIYSEPRKLLYQRLPPEVNP